MNAPDVAAAGLYLLPAFLFTAIASQLWIFRHYRRPPGRLFRLLPILATVLAAHFFVLVERALVPGGLSSDAFRQVLTPWHVEIEISWLVALALLRHVLQLTPLPEKAPSASWLAVNYGLAITGTALSIALRFAPGTSDGARYVAHHVFHVVFAILSGLCLLQFVRTARPGVWGPEGAGEMRGPDVTLVRVGLGAAFVIVPVVWLLGDERMSLVAFDVVIGLAIAAPMVLRMAATTVPALVVTVGLFIVTAGVVGAYGYAVLHTRPSYRLAIGTFVVLALLALLTVGRAALRRVVTRILVPQGQRRLVELQVALQTLSPELGVVACCRRILDELVRVRQLPGAAIMLAGGETIVAGRFDAAPLERVWPRGAAAAALPPGCYGTAELRELPLALREALIRANVGLGAAAIRSRRRHWGHLFMHAGFFGGLFREDEADAFASLVDQLALLLDAADLLARAVAVERSLAHAEKLAAIGALAARFAHEIRNPVTAARSLAQQLARDPTSPLNAEHAGIILEELERVERQVRDLLRFARREELTLGPVDVGALVRTTVRDLGVRLAAAGIAPRLDTPSGVVARADREKLRQVLVNLVENALDALGNGRAEKHVDLAVAADGDRVLVRVTDDGPGIPADAQARIFEPFVSFKPSGTGLGLAIAKRTIDAHDGTISVASRPGATTFEIRLPRAREDAP
jgi:signal transduction histidine kinase